MSSCDHKFKIALYDEDSPISVTFEFDCTLPEDHEGSHKFESVSADYQPFNITWTEPELVMCAVCKMWLHPREIHYDDGVNRECHLCWKRKGTLDKPHREVARFPVSSSA